jgi:hypothetical protein
MRPLVTGLILVVLGYFCSEIFAKPPQLVDQIAKLGGQVAPNTTKKLFVVYMPAGSSVGDGIAQLDRILHANDCHASTFLIGSEDTKLIAKIVLAAFEKLDAKALEGCPVIFVGSESDRSDVERAIRHAGAELYFAPYRAPG